MTEEEELEYLRLKKRKAIAASQGLRAIQMGDLSQVKKPFLEKITEPIKLPEWAKNVASTAYTPVRGIRGLAVGANALAQAAPSFPLHALIPGFQMPTANEIGQMGVAGPDALNRAAAASKPGYVPLPQDKAAAFLGETAGLAGLTVPLAAANLGGPIANTIAQGTIGGGLAAFQEAGNQGTITPTNVVAGSLLSALPTAAIEMAGKAAPAAASTFTKLPKSAYEEVRDVPGFFKKYKGTPQSIETRSNRFFSAFDDLRRKITASLNRSRADLGLKLLKDSDVKEVIEQNIGNRSLQDMQKQWSQLIGLEKEAPKEVPTGLFDAKGKPLYRKVQPSPTSDKDKLKQLYFMLREPSAVPEGPLAEIQHGFKEIIKREIRKFPGGPSLIEAHEGYGTVQKLGRALGDHLTDKATSSNEARNIVNAIMKEDTASLAKAMPSRYAQEIFAVKDLESKTGIKLIEPLKREIMSSILRKPVADSPGLFTRILMAVRPDVAMKEMSIGSPFLASKAVGTIGSTMRAVRSPVARSIIPSAVTVLRKRREGD